MRTYKAESTMIEADLFGTICLVECWGRNGSKGQEKAEVYPTEREAEEALYPSIEVLTPRDRFVTMCVAGPADQNFITWVLEAIARAKRRRDHGIYETALLDGSVATKRKRPLHGGGALRSNP
jgi:hypothetical protein